MKRLLLLPLVGVLTAFTPTMQTQYADLNGRMPTRNKVFICHGSGCPFKASYIFTKGQQHKLRAAMSWGTNPETERAAIAHTIRMIELITCPTAGTCKDDGKMRFWQSGTKGLKDCVDEALNTTSYLLLLERWGLLRYHRVNVPQVRTGFRWPHWTASIRDIQSGINWAVDSDFNNTGQKPRILHLSVWRQQ